MVPAVKIRVHPWEKPNAWLLPRRSVSREEHSLMPCLIQQLLSGSALFQRSRILRQVWVQNYQRVDDVVHWRSSENIPPPSRYIGSPYDEDAQDAQKTEHDLGRI